LGQMGPKKLCLAGQRLHGLRNAPGGAPPFPPRDARWFDLCPRGLSNHLVTLGGVGGAPSVDTLAKWWRVSAGSADASRPLEMKQNLAKPTRRLERPPAPPHTALPRPVASRTLPRPTEKGERGFLLTRTSTPQGLFECAFRSRGSSNRAFLGDYHFLGQMGPKKLCLAGQRLHGLRNASGGTPPFPPRDARWFDLCPRGLSNHQETLGGVGAHRP